MRRVRQLRNQHRRRLHRQHPRRPDNQSGNDELRERRRCGLDDRRHDDAEETSQQNEPPAEAIRDDTDDGQDEDGAEGLGGVDEAEQGAFRVVEVGAPLEKGVVRVLFARRWEEGGSVVRTCGRAWRPLEVEVCQRSTSQISVELYYRTSSNCHHIPPPTTTAAGPGAAGSTATDGTAATTIYPSSAAPPPATCPRSVLPSSCLLE